MRLELLAIDPDEGVLKAVETIAHRPRARADRLRAAHESPAAGQGRRHRPGGPDECRGGQRAAEDARGAAAGHLSHPRLRSAGAPAADDPFALSQASRPAAHALRRAGVARRAGCRRRPISGWRRPRARRWRRWRTPTRACRPSGGPGWPRSSRRSGCRSRRSRRGSTPAARTSARRGSRRCWNG